MLDLLNKTPLWVFILFFSLLAIGFKQSKNRTTSRRALLAFPCVMIFYSSFDLVFNIGVTFIGMTVWAIGLFLAWKISHRLLTPDITYCENNSEQFNVKGSWLPLMVIIGIFTIKYIQGAITALSPEITKNFYFIGFFSFFNGVFLGLFSARVFTYLTLGKSTKINPGNNYSL